MIHLLSVVRAVVDIYLEEGFSGMGGRKNVTHVLGGKHRRPGVELLLLRLGELDGDAVGLALRVAVDVLDQALVQEIL